MLFFMLMFLLLAVADVYMCCVADGISGAKVVVAVVSVVVWCSLLLKTFIHVVQRKIFPNYASIFY